METLNAKQITLIGVIFVVIMSTLGVSAQNGVTETTTPSQAIVTTFRTDTTGPTLSQNNETTTTTETSQPGPAPALTTCVTKCTDDNGSIIPTGDYAYCDDCHAFAKCTYGRLDVMQCPRGTIYYDRVLKVCVSDSNVCFNDSAITINPPTKISTSPESTSTTTTTVAAITTVAETTYATSTVQTTQSFPPSTSSTQTSPPVTTQTSPPVTTQTSPPVTTQTSPPVTTQTSPPVTTQTTTTSTNPPTTTSTTTTTLQSSPLSTTFTTTAQSLSTTMNTVPINPTTTTTFTTTAQSLSTTMNTVPINPTTTTTTTTATTTFASGTTTTGYIPITGAEAECLMFALDLYNRNSNDKMRAGVQSIKSVTKQSLGNDAWYRIYGVMLARSSCPNTEENMNADYRKCPPVDGSNQSSMAECSFKVQYTSQTIKQMDMVYMMCYK